MFNRKKKEIEHLRKRLREADEQLMEEQEEIELADERERSHKARCEEFRKTIEDMTKERDHALTLAVDNGKKLEESLKANVELKRQIKNADTKIKKQKHLLDEARRASECQADCKNRKNHNACRTCTRYPHAKDKYEVTE